MPKLRVFSGKALTALLFKNGFVIERTKGSHVVLKHITGRSVVVPLHREIDRGTLGAIINKLESVLSKEFISKNFYR